MKKLLSTTSLVILGALAMTQISLAVGPSNPPPSPNLPDAVFNKVTAGSSSTSGVNISATSSDNYAISGTTLSTTGSGVYGGSSTGNGVIGSATAANKSGVFGSNAAGVGVYGSGAAGVQGLSSADNSLVQGGVVGLNNAVNGIGVYGYNSSGSAGTGSAVYGYSLRNNGVYGYSNSGTGLLGAAGTASAVAGKFTNTAAGSTVNIGSSAYALDVTGTSSKLDTDLDIQGTINNSSAQNAGYIRYSDNLVMDPGYGLYTSLIRGETYNSGTNTSVTGNLSLAGFPDLSLSAQYASGGLIKLNSALAGVIPNSVTVKDPQGFAMENYSGSGNPAGTQTLIITENGELANPTTAPVTIRDNEGLSVKDTFGFSTLFAVDGTGHATFNGPSSMWADTVSINTSAYGGAALDGNNTNAFSGFGVRGSGTTGVVGGGSVSGVLGTASGTGTGVTGVGPSTTSGQAGLFFNGKYTVDLATPSYGVNSSGPIYATSTATGSSATITASLPASYNGNGINAYTYNAGSYSIYAYNSAGGEALHASGKVNVVSPGSSNVALEVAGRIKTGDGSNLGGVWVDNAMTQFVGQVSATQMGFYNSGWRLWVDNAGGLYVPSATAQKGGGGSWGVYSDARLKDVKGNFDRGLADILKANPIKYMYKKDNPKHLDTDKTFIGFVAQEIQKAIPEAVTEGSDGYLVVNNDPIIWTMLNAIKELAGKDEALKQENAQLKTKVENLEQRLNALEAKLN